MNSSENIDSHKRIKKKSAYDITLIILTVFLCIFGLIMVYSTSFYNAHKYYNDEKLYFNRQLLFLGIGLSAMIIISLIDYRIYFKVFCLKKVNLVWIGYIVCFALQCYVLIKGYSAGGSSRWINLGFTSFQPSEFTKILIIVLVAYLAQMMSKKLNTLGGFVGIAIIVSPLIVLVAIENLSTAIVMAGILVSICFVTSERKWYFVVVFIALAAFGTLFILTEGYRGERIDNWLHPENLDGGSQILQGLYAIASGGLWGKGLGESSQKLGYIPEVHTDMIFTVVCEELGIIGAIALIAVFMMLFWRMFVIALNASDLLGSLITTGVLTQIALQFLINIAVVTNSMPATGIPLPFISYGGSSVVVLLAEMGLVLSVSRYSELKSEEI